MSGSTDRWWEREPGIDPRDWEWIEKHEHELAQPIPDIGPCFACWQVGEQPAELLGPFRSTGEAHAAHDSKLAELAAQGIDLLAADIKMSVIFADPAVNHMPTGGSCNG